MTQQERAQVAFKALGIALLAQAMRRAPETWRVVLSEFRDSSVSSVAAVASWLSIGLLPAVMGVPVIVAARPMARRLLPEADPAPPLPEESLGTGVCLMGLLWLLSTLTMIPIALALLVQLPGVGGRLAGVLSGAFVTLAVAALSAAFMFRPRQVAALCAGLAGGPPQSTLVAGLCAIGLWFGSRGLVMVLSLYSGILQVSHDALMPAGVRLRLALSWFANSGSEILLAVLLVFLARRIASWFGRAADADGGAGEGVRLGSTAALALVVQVAVAGLFMGVSLGVVRMSDIGSGPAGLFGLPQVVAGYLGDLLGRVLPGLDAAAEVVAALFAAVGLPLLAIAGLWLAGWLAWPVARLLHKPSDPDAEAASPALPALLEVALALLGLYLAVGFLRPTTVYLIGDDGTPLPAAPWRLGALLAALGALAVVIFRADLARLTAHDGAREDVDRATRVALLQPWLVLLGAWLVSREGPALLSWAAMSLSPGADALPAGVPRWGALPGLLLMFGARSLAAVLSFGPLICGRPTGRDAG